tara:strand:+ start:44 stop:292 length:249 start_codon:yes stop_codon:yes gene_type:complete
MQAILSLLFGEGPAGRMLNGATPKADAAAVVLMKRRRFIDFMIYSVVALRGGLVCDPGWLLFEICQDQETRHSNLHVAICFL